MHKKILLSTILALASMPLLAANYYVVVPTQAKGQVSEKITVKLNAATMPESSVGASYPGFDFNTVLQVIGDPDYDGAQVIWDVVAGKLPAGLTLNPNGTVTGTPTTETAAALVTVKATYRTSIGQQEYFFQVATPTIEVWAFTDFYGDWFGFTSTGQCLVHWDQRSFESRAVTAQACYIDIAGYRYRPLGSIRDSLNIMGKITYFYDISREKL